jgi:polyhydroxybutyrate depolymerase
MRRLAVALVAFVVLAAACSSSDDKASKDTVAPSTSAVPDGATRTIKVDGRTRTYLVHRPTSIDPDDGTSLVVMLHGGFGSAAQARQSYGWDAKADLEGFVVVYPNGIDKAWNAGTCCGRPQTEGIDDVKFLGAVIDEVTKTENVVPDHVYATGISNGGMMAYRLACELPGKVAAIGPVAATMTVPCENPQPRPTGVLHIHGLDDRNVPFDGGVGTKGVAKDSRPSVPSVIERWRAIDACTGTPATATSGVVTTVTSASCAAGTLVELVTVAGAGHQWPGSAPPTAAAKRLLDLDDPSTALDATAVLWDFFSRQPQ